MNYHQHDNCQQCIDKWWQWASTQPVAPIKGFGDKRNPDGTLFTVEQQQQTTKLQLYLIISDLCSRGKSSTCIQTIISAFF
jgi:hypothetical protein